MKRTMMERRKARGTPGMFKSLMAKQQEATSARAAALTPAHNAQADPTVTPMSEEERRRRRGTVLNPTDKLG